MKCHEGDSHVLATAVRCEADAIVANKTKHFPAEILEPYGLERLTVDEFLLHQFSLDDSLVREKLADLAEVRQWELGTLLDRVSQMAPKFAARIRVS